eukprot:10413226-Lingulodinium_polyedra.AAC.1
MSNKYPPRLAEVALVSCVRHSGDAEERLMHICYLESNPFGHLGARGHEETPPLALVGDCLTVRNL